jgi:hypothetical protein
MARWKLIAFFLFSSALAWAQQASFPSATGTASSVGLAMPATFCTVTNSPVTTTGTLTCTYATGQTGNLIFGTTSGGNVGLMNLTGAQLPNPSSSTLGGIQSLAVVTHKWINTISTSGVPAATQPACGDLSDSTASCATDATNAANIASGTLPSARIVALPNANLANSQVTVNTTAPLTGGGAVALGATITAACATCATTTNGGALSGTAQIAVSAAGAISSSDTTNFDNTILSSSVDASGNPNFLGTAANTVLPINGGSTSLVMYIAGLKQTLNTNVTLTLPVTASVQQWILAKQDTVNANLVAADFLGMNTAPAYAYAAPTCPSPSPALSATNPAFWFDLSTGLSKLCTTNAGSYAASPSIVLGVVDVNATPLIDFTLSEPFRLSPFKRIELFGTGSDGTLAVTSGTTTIDVFKQYASATVTGGTLNGTAYSATNTTVTGVAFQSQNPVMIIGGTVTQTGKGRVTASPGTGVGANGSQGSLGGSGGGGGGSGTTSAAGGTGGNHYGVTTFATNAQGGTAGAATPTAGGAGTASAAMYPYMYYLSNCAGASGGNGAGDGTNNGGQGGAAGGTIFIKAPSILVASGISVVANGGNGGNGAAGNAGGGGAGGGGCLFLNGGFVSSSGATITAASGSVGTHAGTGSDGGLGGVGVVQQNRLW